MAKAATDKMIEIIQERFVSAKGTIVPRAPRPAEWLGETLLTRAEAENIDTVTKHSAKVQNVYDRAKKANEQLAVVQQTTSKSAGQKQ